MTNHNEEIEHLHVNTGGKQLSEKEFKEMEDFINSSEFKEMIEKSKEQHKRVMESKITERTKMWLKASSWRFNINI